MEAWRIFVIKVMLLIRIDIYVSCLDSSLVECFMERCKEPWSSSSKAIPFQENKFQTQCCFTWHQNFHRTALNQHMQNKQAVSAIKIGALYHSSWSPYSTIFLYSIYSFLFMLFITDSNQELNQKRFVTCHPWRDKWFL